MYLRARYYDPSTGRFQTKDPVKGCAGQPVTLNGYAYARNNPATFVDPKGTWEYEPGVSGAVGGPGNSGSSWVGDHPQAEMDEEIARMAGLDWTPGVGTVYRVPGGWATTPTGYPQWEYLTTVVSNGWSFSWWPFPKITPDDLLRACKTLCDLTKSTIFSAVGCGVACVGAVIGGPKGVLMCNALCDTVMTTQGIGDNYVAECYKTCDDSYGPRRGIIR